jgi:hypothetical protein
LITPNATSTALIIISTTNANNHVNHLHH